MLNSGNARVPLAPNKFVSTYFLVLSNTRQKYLGVNPQKTNGNRTTYSLKVI